jgi:hypothetical protein
MPPLPSPVWDCATAGSLLTMADCPPTPPTHPPPWKEWLEEASEEAEPEGHEEKPRALAKLASLVEAEDIDYVDVEGDAFEGLHQVGGGGMPWD